MVENRVLFVDDDANILSSYKRLLRQKYEITTANSAHEAIELIKKQPNYFTVIVTDYRMPEINGIQLMSIVSEISPLSIRVLLTAYADVETAISIVNKGSVFRFLTKPCPSETLVKHIDECIKQYKLVIAEKELLRGTLQGSIKVLTDILALTNPVAFGQTERIKLVTQGILKRLQISNKWQIEVAAMLGKIGCAALPSEIVDKVYRSIPLTEEEQNAYNDVPRISAQLIKNIPRMEGVVELIEKQDYTEKDKKNTPIGARIIRIINDFDILSKGGTEILEAIRTLKTKPELYDIKLIEALEKTISPLESYVQRLLMVADLREKMIVTENVKTKNNTLLIGKGQVLNEASIYRLHNFLKATGIKEPISVLVEVKD